MPRGATIGLYLCLGSLAGCALIADPNSAESTDRDLLVPGLRYEHSVFDSTWLRTVTRIELHIPSHGICCRVDSEGSPLGGLEMSFPVHVLRSPIRNTTHDRLSAETEESPTTRIYIPRALADQLSELAALNDRRDALAKSLGPELMRLTPMNARYELATLLADSDRDVTDGSLSDSNRNARFKQAADRALVMFEDSETPDLPARLRQLRQRTHTIDVGKKL